jgi:glycine cleavage system H lipoate-binding protein
VVSGFALAANYYYHVGHAWARVEYGGRVRVGLDDFASRLFGPSDRFDLPKLGCVLRQGEPGFGLVRGSLQAGCLCPVEGVVVAVNPGASGENGPLPLEPYDEALLMVIEPVKLLGGLKNLFFEEESRAWLDDEVSSLTAMVSAETGMQLAATGGRALPDIFGRMPELGWDRLKKAFLRT